MNKLNFQRYFIAHICLGIKDYFGLSLRRSKGLIRFIFWAMRWKCTLPCFKTPDNYMMKRECSQIQEAILEFTVQPLVYVENHFNIDSTPDSLFTSSSWYDYRISKKRKRKDGTSQEWKRTVTAQKKNDPLEIDTYNIRQNAESTNHAKKSKFGSKIRSKLDRTKEAEAMGKWCVYNVTAICRAYYDDMIEPKFIQSNMHIERMLTYTQPSQTGNYIND